MGLAIWRLKCILKRANLFWFEVTIYSYSKNKIKYNRKYYLFCCIKKHVNLFGFRMTDSFLIIEINWFSLSFSSSLSNWEQNNNVMATKWWCNPWGMSLLYWKGNICPITYLLKFTLTIMIIMQKNLLNNITITFCCNR